jgi:transposase-like protein/DDE family transposase
MTTSLRIPAASEEFAGADFGDERLSRRLVRIADAAAASPSAGFPTMTQSDGELEGVYRFLGNSRVTPRTILAPHLGATQARAGTATVIIAHDTTDLGFGGLTQREGLGLVGTTNTRQGFFAHFALAVSADESRTALGVVGMKPFIRDHKRSRIPKMDRDRHPERSEARKWTEVALDANRAFPNSIHVMDREADSYTVLARLVEAGARFVMRLGRDKRIDDSSHLLFRTAELRCEVRATRSVPLARRRPHRSSTKRKEHPPRSERYARLELRAARIPISRPKRARYSTGYPDQLDVNFVLVQEVDAPAGEEPVCWRLVTTEPIDTAEQVEAIVDAYRARWRIEEFFKALKTGCAFEKRQLESLRTLVNALAMFSVIAWRLLLLRSVAQAAPHCPATSVLTREQVDLLQRIAKMRDPALPQIHMPRKATANDALLAVARLGGHIKNNGPPGWIVLGRGYDKLLLLCLGYRAALGST